MGAVPNLGIVTREAERSCMCCYGKREARLVASLVVLYCDVVMLEAARVGEKHSCTPLIPTWNRTLLCRLEPNRRNTPPPSNTVGTVERRQRRTPSLKGDNDDDDEVASPLSA